MRVRRTVRRTVTWRMRGRSFPFSPWFLLSHLSWYVFPPLFPYFRNPPRRCTGGEREEERSEVTAAPPITDH